MLDKQNQNLKQVINKLISILQRNQLLIPNEIEEIENMMNEDQVMNNNAAAQHNIECSVGKTDTKTDKSDQC